MRFCKFLFYFFSCLLIFKVNFYKKGISGIPAEWQTVCFQIRPGPEVIFAYAKVLVSMGISSGPTLLADAIGTKIACIGRYYVKLWESEKNTRKSSFLSQQMIKILQGTDKTTCY